LSECTSCGSGGGAFAVEVHEVGEDGFGAELANHGGDLSAMVRSVIGEMLQRLPEGIFVDAEVQSFVFEDAVEVGLVRPLT